MHPGKEGSLTRRPVTRCSESRKETARLTPLLTPITKARVATWNIRTRYETGKTNHVAREMKNYKIGVLGLSETRWLQSGQLRLSSGEQLLYSGNIEDGAPPSPSPSPSPSPLILRVWPYCWHRKHMGDLSAGNLSTPASLQPSLHQEERHQAEHHPVLCSHQ